MEKIDHLIAISKTLYDERIAQQRKDISCVLNMMNDVPLILTFLLKRKKYKLMQKEFKEEDNCEDILPMHLIDYFPKGVNERDTMFGRNALHHYFRSGKFSVDIVKELIELGIDIHKEDYFEDSCVDALVSSYVLHMSDSHTRNLDDIEDMEHDASETLAFLLEKGVIIKKEDNFKIHLLHEQDSVRLLLSR